MLFQEQRSLHFTITQIAQSTSQKLPTVTLKRAIEAISCNSVYIYYSSQVDPIASTIGFLYFLNKLKVDI